MNPTLLLIQCSDAVGLVATISQLLAKYKLNITAMREFVDEKEGSFFARVECSGPQIDENTLLSELRGCLPNGSSIRINPNKEKRIAVLVTKEYHCLADILTRHHFDTLGASVCCVIGNHKILKDFTEKIDIPFYHITHQGKTKNVFETEIQSVIDGFQPDYLVLAKFMRILSSEFVASYPQKIINIHHSFLPAFVGAQPYKQAFERGVKLIGATSHFVTNHLDEGPIIAQKIIEVNHNFTAKDMLIAGKEIEKSVLSRAVTLLVQDRVFVSGNKTIVFE